MAEVESRIAALEGDDKQAVFVASQLAAATLSALPPEAPLDPPDIATRLDELAAQAGLSLPRLADLPGWESVTFTPEASGPAARELLSVMADAPGGAPLVAAALDEFEDTSAAFDPLSLAAAVSLFYVALSVEIDGEVLGLKIRKAGLSPAQQIRLVQTTLPKLVEAAMKGLGLGGEKPPGTGS